jgi:hypothetical protein
MATKRIVLLIATTALPICLLQYRLLHFFRTNARLRIFS